MPPLPGHARKHESLGYKVSELHWLETMLLNRLLAPLGLRRGQIAVLADVLTSPGIAQDELNALQGTDRSATSRCLASLERAGLVTRTVNPGNARQKIVHPTDAARNLAEEFFAALRVNSTVLFEGFSRIEREQLMGFMDRVIHNVRRNLEDD